MLPTEQIQWLIPSIQNSALNNSQLHTLIADKEAELKRLPITQHINELKKLLKEGESEEQQLREEGANIMLLNGLKEMKMLDGTIISLSKTPWALVVSSEENIPAEYYNEKTTRTLDKMALKKAFLAGECLDPNLTVEVTYKLIIK